MDPTGCMKGRQSRVADKKKLRLNMWRKYEGKREEPFITFVYLSKLIIIVIQLSNISTY
jgi:hypothetical protein